VRRTVRRQGRRWVGEKDGETVGFEPVGDSVGGRWCDLDGEVVRSEAVQRCWRRSMVEGDAEKERRGGAVTPPALPTLRVRPWQGDKHCTQRPRPPAAAGMGGGAAAFVIFE